MSKFKRFIALFTMLLIIAGVVFSILLCFDFVNCWKWIVLIILGFYGINFLLSMYIFYSKQRTDKEKKCWIIIMFILPVIAPFLFFKYGYFAYYKTYEDNVDQVINQLDAIYKTDENNSKDNNLELISKYAYKNFKYSINNGSIEKVDNIESLYEETIKEIRKAKKIILLNFYIFGDSNWFKAIVNELIKKTNEGVKVYILFDPFGSKKKISKDTLRKLSQLNNLYISEFREKQSLLVKSVDNNRSHKKVMIIDGEIAFYGGFNICDEYNNMNTKYHFWFDEGYKVKGEILNDLIKSYIIDWTVYGNNSKDIFDDIKNLNLLHKRQKNNNSEIVFYESNPENNHKRMLNYYSFLFSFARKRIYINTPYLYLSEEMIEQFIFLAKTGVEIKILLPYHYDNKKFITLINEIQYDQLIKNGIEIYEVDAFNHCKSIIIDDYVIIGTTNLDQRALCLNYENCLVVKNSDLLTKKINEFNYKLTKSIKIKEKIKKDISLFNKIFVKLLMITETLL